MLSVACFRIHTGGELFRVDTQAGDALLKQLWHHSDAIMCCSLKTNVISSTSCLIRAPQRELFEVPVMLSQSKLNIISKYILQASPVFTFANQAGLDMLETTLVALQDIMLDKILDEAGRKVLCSEFAKIMQQVILHSSVNTKWG